MISADDSQLESLRRLIGELLAGNAFYAPKLHAAGLNADLDRIETFVQRMPLTVKADLLADQQAHPPYGTNLTYAPDRYTRFSQTSGSTGQSLCWVDTPQSWSTMLDCWRCVYESAGVGVNDRVLFAFSFGPFLGFWTAFEAALQLGAMAMPAGGLSSRARLKMLFDHQVSVLCCTPTYAIRLGQTARELNMDAAQSKLRCILVAGEPGGSAPETRQVIQQLWPTADVFDHHGMTEVGPVSYQHAQQPGVLHVMSHCFLGEIIDPKTLAPAPVGEIGELVLTTLRRTACPLLRYRTGDLVRQGAASSASDDLPLDGGVLGRLDDMVIIRGVNVYPAAIDRLIRQFDGAAEYRVFVANDRGMSEMTLQVEPTHDVADADQLCRDIAEALREQMQLRVPVSAVEPDALPRFEMKAKRWIQT